MVFYDVEGCRPEDGYTEGDEECEKGERCRRKTGGLSGRRLREEELKMLASSMVEIRNHCSDKSRTVCSSLERDRTRRNKSRQVPGHTHVTKNVTSSSNKPRGIRFLGHEMIAP